MNLEHMYEGEAEATFAAFLPKVKQLAEKKPEEITPDELNVMIDESDRIELVPENQIVFSSLVDLRRALFRPDDRPKQTASELMEILRRATG